MNRSALLLGVASVLAGTSVLLGVLGAAFNPILIAFAVPFAAAAYLLWMDATGRLQERLDRRRRRAARTRRSANRDRRAAGRAASGPGSGRPDPEGPSRSRARQVLGVSPEADQSEIRAAYRTRAKEVHPDADGGDEETFKRVSAAYDRLRD